MRVIPESGNLCELINAIFFVIVFSIVYLGVTERTMIEKMVTKTLMKSEFQLPYDKPSAVIFWKQCFTCTMCLMLSAAGFHGSLVAADETAQPNVVLIMVDDLGYNDLGSFGHPKINTPVLDKLANDGIRLTDYYAGASVCTPSRMALLAGCYPARVGWKQGVIGYKMGLREGLHPRVITVAEIFQVAGYATAMSGKWHLGSEPPCRPHRQGFDVAYYVDKSNNQTKK